MTRRAKSVLCTVAGLLTACETLAPSAPPAPPPAPQTASVVALYRQPAERSLIDGIRAYEEASFERSEKALRAALREGLADSRDRAAAYKYLAFIACAFNRIEECEASFRNAFAADPGFALTDVEIGHPLWGPVYRRVAAAQPKK